MGSYTVRIAGSTAWTEGVTSLRLAVRSARGAARRMAGQRILVVDELTGEVASTPSGQLLDATHPVGFDVALAELDEVRRYRLAARLAQSRHGGTPTNKDWDDASA